MIYKITLDRSSKVITGLVLVLLISIFVKSLYDELGLIPQVSLGILFGSILFLSWAWSPRQFELNEQTLIVRKFWGSIEIPRAEITECRAIESSEISGSVRLMGSGGLFGYYGKFNNSKLKTYNLQAGNRVNLVLVKTANKTYVLTPDKREDFLKNIQANRIIAQ